MDNYKIVHAKIKKGTTQETEVEMCRLPLTCLIWESNRDVDPYRGWFLLAYFVFQFTYIAPFIIKVVRA